MKKSKVIIGKINILESYSTLLIDKLLVIGNKDCIVENEKGLFGDFPLKGISVGEITKDGVFRKMCLCGNKEIIFCTIDENGNIVIENSN